MREYGKISPQFWIGRTGKALRGNAEAQVLALYLVTSPHANMIGLYHCPIAYMAHETGLTIEGASKALRCLIEADFCTYDDEDEYVFVHQFVMHQVGDDLSVNDKRCKGVENALSRVPKNQCWQAFRARYAEAFNLSPVNAETKPLRSPFEAPSKPGAGAGAEIEEGCKHPPAQATADAEALAAAAVDKAAALPPCPAEQLVGLYHELLPELPRCRTMLDARAKALRRRWRWVLCSRKADGQRRAVDAEAALGWFRAFFERVRHSDWLMGRTPRGPGHQGWQCDLDFLLSDKGVKAVVESTELRAEVAA